MSTIYDAEVEEYTRLVEQLREFARLNTTNRTPEFARAVWLVVPKVCFMQGFGVESLDTQMALDYQAGYAFGGYHGYDFDTITDWAETIAHWYAEGGD